MPSVDLLAVRLHDLRHTYATLGLASNVHPKVMQERLGHSSITVTMDTYSHVTQAMDRDAAHMLGNLIAGTSGPSGYRIRPIAISPRLRNA